MNKLMASELYETPEMSEKKKKPIGCISFRRYIGEGDTATRNNYAILDFAFFINGSLKCL